MTTTAITRLLQAWVDGDDDAREAVINRLYPELRRMARARLRREGRAITMEPTLLAHEAYLRLEDQQRTRWQNRRHFFAIAARIMRRVLVDHRRARGAQKRGANAPRVCIDDVSIAAPVEPDVAVLYRALARLAEQDARQARVVELRFFGGLTVEETAEALGVSPATVKREWTMARAWLKREVDPELGGMGNAP